MLGHLLENREILMRIQETTSMIFDMSLCEHADKKYFETY